MFNPQLFFKQVQAMHQQAPLVHGITNDVVVNFTANVLLAIGASPAMVVAEEESPAFTKVACSLLINIGTLTAPTARSMLAAVAAAHEAGTPWVLDPVAYGAMSFRTEFCKSLLCYRPAVIRGNAAEIAAMAGQAGLSKGPDSLTSGDEVLGCARKLAQEQNTVVAMTGQTDYVTDGSQMFALRNGHTQLTRVTGAGCSLSAMVAAYCDVSVNPLQAALSALSHMAIAGEVAAQNSKGAGSFAVALLDTLQCLTPEQAQQLQFEKL